MTNPNQQAPEAEVIYLTNVRLSFPHLLQAHASTADAQAKFMGDFIMAPDNPGYEAVRNQAWQLAQAKWGDIATQVFQQIEADRKLRNYGNEQDKLDKKTMQPLNGYAGHLWVMANNQYQPQAIGPDGRVIDPANQMAVQACFQKMYGGCYVNAAIKVWLQDNSFGRAVRTDLIAVQFMADGESFGIGTPDVSGGFGAIAGAPATTGSVPGAAAVPQAGFGVPGQDPMAYQAQGVPGQAEGMSAGAGQAQHGPGQAGAGVPGTPQQNPQGVPGQGAPGAIPGAAGTIPGAAAPLQQVPGAPANPADPNSYM